MRTKKYFKGITSDLGQSLTLICYSSDMSEMDEEDKLHLNYDLPYKNDITLDTVLASRGC